MLKLSGIGCLVLALVAGANQANAQLAVSGVTISPATISVDSSLDIHYTLTNSTRDTVRLQTSIQIYDNRGQVLHASPWTTRILAPQGRGAAAWDGSFLRGLLEAREASELHVGIWLGVGSRQEVVVRRNLVRTATAEVAFVCPDCSAPQQMRQGVVAGVFRAK